MPNEKQNSELVLLCNGVQYCIYTILEYRCSPWASWKRLYCQCPIGIIMGNALGSSLIWLIRHDEVKWLLSGCSWYILPCITWLRSWSLEPLPEPFIVLSGAESQGLSARFPLLSRLILSLRQIESTNQNTLYEIRYNEIKKQGGKVLLHILSSLLRFWDTGFQEVWPHVELLSDIYLPFFPPYQLLALVILKVLVKH